MRRMGLSRRILHLRSRGFVSLRTFHSLRVRGIHHLLAHLLLSFLDLVVVIGLHFHRCGQSGGEESEYEDLGEEKHVV